MVKQFSAFGNPRCCCDPSGPCDCTVDAQVFSGNGCNVTLPNPCFEYQVSAPFCPNPEVADCPCDTSDGASYAMDDVGAVCDDVGSRSPEIDDAPPDCNVWGGLTIVGSADTDNCHLKFLIGGGSGALWQLLVPKFSLEPGTYFLSYVSGEPTLFSFCCKVVSGVGDVELEIL